MGTDNFHIKNKICRKEKEVNIRKERNLKWLVVCEGEKTEKYYFEGLEEFLNTNGKKEIKIRAEGLGKNTKSLVNSVEDYFRFVDKCYGEMTKIIPYQNIIFVFDKDSFKPDQFNDAVAMAESYKSIVNQSIVAWSNESFELWINLHFGLIVSALRRDQYNDRLTDKFREFNILKDKENYEDNGKNLEEIFQAILNANGSLKNAIKYSKKLYDENFVNTPSNANPCTTVFQAVEALIKEAEFEF